MGGWKELLGRVRSQIGEDHVPLLAAALAFYAILAVFPALIALVTIYGLVSDPQQVEQQLAGLSHGLGGGAGQLLRGQLESIVRSSHSALSWGLVVSVAGALWAASSGIQALIKAVNLAYDEQETRGFVRLRALALLLTVGGMVFVIVAVALIAVLPAVLSRLGLGAVATAIGWGRWLLLAVSALVALGVVYEVAPDRSAHRRRWLSPGAATATVLWLAISWAFGFYVQHFGSYNKTYGSLAGVIVLLMWFYLSGYVALLGAELNSELERRAAEPRAEPRDDGARTDRPPPRASPPEPSSS